MRKSLREEFDENWLGEPNSGCWLWMGTLRNKDYGMIGHLRLAHRVSWELHRGPIPKGMWVLHRCDTPLCVNPAHLFLGTNSDNVADKMNKGRHFAQSGELHGMSKLTECDVRNIRKIYADGGITHKELARYFQVGSSTIRRAVNAENWQHVA